MMPSKIEDDRQVGVPITGGTTPVIETGYVV